MVAVSEEQLNIELCDPNTSEATLREHVRDAKALSTKQLKYFIEHHPNKLTVLQELLCTRANRKNPELDEKFDGDTIIHDKEFDGETILHIALRVKNLAYALYIAQAMNDRKSIGRDYWAVQNAEGLSCFHLLLLELKGRRPSVIMSELSEIPEFSSMHNLQKFVGKMLPAFNEALTKNHSSRKYKGRDRTPFEMIFGRQEKNNFGQSLFRYAKTPDGNNIFQVNFLAPLQPMDFDKNMRIRCFFQMDNDAPIMFTQLATNQNTKGDTALHQIIGLKTAANNKLVARYLSKFQDCLSIKNAKGQTPFAYATDIKNQAVLEALGTASDKKHDSWVVGSSTSDGTARAAEDAVATSSSSPSHQQPAPQRQAMPRPPLGSPPPYHPQASQKQAPRQPRKSFFQRFLCCCGGSPVSSEKERLIGDPQQPQHRQ